MILRLLLLLGAAGAAGARLVSIEDHRVARAEAALVAPVHVGLAWPPALASVEIAVLRRAPQLPAERELWPGAHASAGVRARFTSAWALSDAEWEAALGEWGALFVPAPLASTAPLASAWGLFSSLSPVRAGEDRGSRLLSFPLETAPPAWLELGERCAEGGWIRRAVCSQLREWGAAEDASLGLAVHMQVSGLAQLGLDVAQVAEFPADGDADRFGAARARLGKPASRFHGATGARAVVLGLDEPDIASELVGMFARPRKPGDGLAAASRATWLAPSVRFWVRGRGQHRTLELRADVVSLEGEREEACTVVALLALPRELYVDVDELRDLDLPVRAFEPFIDVEAPAASSTPHVVAVTLPQGATLEMPLHTRYQAPAAPPTGLGEAILEAPALYVRCGAGPRDGAVLPWDLAPAWPPSAASEPPIWEAVRVDTDVGRLSVRVPLGDLGSKDVVDTVTLLVTGAAAVGLCAMMVGRSLPSLSAASPASLASLGS